MRKLISYAYHRGYFARYLILFPITFVGEEPYWLKLLAYLVASVGLLAVAAVGRRREQKAGKVLRPTYSESLARSHADIPKRIGTVDVPGVFGVVAAGPLRGGHFLLWEYGAEASVMVVSRWWPHRVRYMQEFGRTSEWRRWAACVDARVLPTGPYTQAVFRKYFEGPFEALDARDDEV